MDFEQELKKLKNILIFWRVLVGHYSSRIKPLWVMLTENCFSWDESRLKSFVYSAESFVF